MGEGLETTQLGEKFLVTEWEWATMCASCLRSQACLARPACPVLTWKRSL